MADPDEPQYTHSTSNNTRVFAQIIKRKKRPATIEAMATTAPPAPKKPRKRGQFVAPIRGLQQNATGNSGGGSIAATSETGKFQFLRPESS